MEKVARWSTKAAISLKHVQIDEKLNKFVVAALTGNRLVSQSSPQQYNSKNNDKKTPKG